MTKRKHILLVTGLAAVVLFTVFLPTILSSPSVLQRLLPQINRYIPGTLALTSWTLRWNSGLQASGIVYSDPHQGISIALDRAIAQKGLLQLILTPRQLGEIVFHKPVVQFTRNNQRPRQEVDRGEDTASGEAVVRTGSDPSVKGAKPIWEGVTARFKVNYGRVLVRQGLSAEREVAREIVIDADIAEGRMNHSLHLVEGSRGRLDAEGFVNLPVYTHNMVETLVSDTLITASSLDVAGLLELAGLFGNFPKGSGSMDGRFNLRTSGLKDIQVKGKILLNNLQCTGGFLGSDKPAYQKVRAEFDGGRDVRRGWYLLPLTFEADGISLQVRGQFGTGEGQLQSSGSIDLSALAQRFPALLKARDWDRLDSGKVQFSANLTKKADVFGLDASLLAKDLQGVHRGRSFNWSTPVQLVIQAEKGPDEVFINRLSVEAPFIQASGSGSLDDFSLQATADLGQVFSEVGKFFPLAWHGQGTLHLEATTSPAEGGRYHVDTDLAVDDFALLRGSRQLLPPHRLTMTAQARAGRSWLQGEGTVDGQLQVNGLHGTLHLWAAAVSRKGNKLSGRFNLNSALNLGHLTALASSLGLLEPTLQLDGILALNVSTKLTDQLLLIRRLNAAIENMMVARGNIVYRDPRIDVSIRGQGDSPTLRTADSMQIHDLVVVRSWEDLQSEGDSESVVDLRQRKLFIDNLEIDSRAVELASTQLTVNDWLNPLEGFTVRSKATADLQKVNTVLQDLGKMPEETEIAGAMTVYMQGQSLNTGNQRVSIELQTDSLDISRSRKPVVQGEEVNLKARMEGDLVAGNILFPVVSLQSALFELLASGAYERADSPFLSLEGNMTPKAVQLGELLTRVSGHRVEISGDRPQAFSLTCPLPGSAKTILEQMVLSAGLSVDGFRALGIEVDQVELPIVWKAGVLKATLQGRVSEGTLLFSPLVDFSAAEALLTVPAGSQVLEKVQLQQPLVDGILSRMHPLFGILARPSGVADLYLDNLSWPMAVNGSLHAEFTSILNVSQVALDSAGLMREILVLAGLGDEPLSLGDTEITCQAKLGRISCTPVRILVAGSEMTMQGSLGMDATLDYQLEIPVTDRLVGREGYRVLAGTTIKVPIRGTLGQPLYNRNMIVSAVRDLVNQAAVKTLEKEVDKVLPDVLNNLFGQ